MTLSILARDSDTGAVGGAAATGSLCVGAWVLRGDLRAGMSASQGASPSTLWGQDVLDKVRAGFGVKAAVSETTGADAGRGHRQLAVLDLKGRGVAFTGDWNSLAMGSRVFDGGVAAGNLLEAESVLDAMVGAYRSASGAILAERLLAALRAAQRAGSDRRGLLSAALLVLSPDHPPLDLRIDYDDAPLDALEGLYRRATSGDYRHWTRQVPTLSHPQRVLDEASEQPVER